MKKSTDCDAFDENATFFKSASLRGPVGRASRNRRKRRKALEGGGSEVVDFDAFDEIDDFAFRQMRLIARTAG